MAEVEDQKWAWAAEQPSSELVLTFSSEFLPTMAPEEQALLLLFMVQGPEGMGQATAECVGGCECRSTTMDGAWTQADSVAVPWGIKVRQERGGLGAGGLES